MSQARGVSLIEVMITLGLFLMFLVAAGGLVLKASRVLRFSEAKSNSLRAITFALDRMAADAGAAQQLISPNSGSADTLSVLVVDPSSGPRLHGNPAPPSFPILQLNVAPYMLEIDYAVSGRRLERQVSRDGTVLSLSRVGERIESLECTRGTGDILEISLKTQEERGPRTVSTAVALLVGVP